MNPTAQYTDVNQKVAELDRLMQQLCWITLNDAGIERAEAERMVMDCHTEREIRAAVIEFARDNSLDLSTDPWMGSTGAT